SLGVARSATIDSAHILGRWNKWRHRVHVSRKKERRSGLLWRVCKHVEAVALHRHLLHLVPQPGEFPVQKFSHRAFIPGDRLNVYKLTSERDDVHQCKQDNVYSISE